MLKRMLPAGEKDLDLNEVLRNAAEILRQARLARTQMSDAQGKPGQSRKMYTAMRETPEQNGAEADRMNEESVKKAIWMGKQRQK